MGTLEHLENTRTREHPLWKTIPSYIQTKLSSTDQHPRPTVSHDVTSAVVLHKAPCGRTRRVAICGSVHGLHMSGNCFHINHKK
jgi:hypothetical protein